MTTYEIVMLVTGTLLAALSSARIAYVLSVQKWRLDDEPSVFFSLGAVIAITAVSYTMGTALVELKGSFGGMLYIIASIPLVGAIFAFVVGSIKAMELALHGLSQKIN